MRHKPIWARAVLVLGLLSSYWGTAIPAAAQQGQQAPAEPQQAIPDAPDRDALPQSPGSESASPEKLPQSPESGRDAHDAVPAEKTASERAAQGEVMSVADLIKAVAEKGSDAEMSASTAGAFGFFAPIHVKLLKAAQSTAAVTPLDSENSLLLSSRSGNAKQVHTWLLRVSSSGEFISAKHVIGDAGKKGESINSRFAPVSDEERAAALHQQQVFWTKRLQKEGPASGKQAH